MLVVVEVVEDEATSRRFRRRRDIMMMLNLGELGLNGRYAGVGCGERDVRCDDVSYTTVHLEYHEMVNQSCVLNE